MDDGMAIQTEELAVLGMSCGSCVERIRGGLAGTPGVESAEVELGRVRVSFHPQAVSLRGLRAKIESLGYQVSPSKASRGRLGGLLDRMAKANEKAFGNQRLDCCSLKKD